MSQSRISGDAIRAGPAAMCAPQFAGFCYQGYAMEQTPPSAGQGAGAEDRADLGRGVDPVANTPSKKFRQIYSPSQLIHEYDSVLAALALPTASPCSRGRSGTATPPPAGPQPGFPGRGVRGGACCAGPQACPSLALRISARAISGLIPWWTNRLYLWTSSSVRRRS
jgi:hypothetical protein